jgi:hypothetical protein
MVSIPCLVRVLWSTMVFAALACPLAANAASVTLLPTADATMMETVPDNSMGAAEWVLSGTTQNGPRNRALMRFDIAGSIPAGSQITGVAMTIAAIRQSREAPAGASFGLHRVLRSWGEGVTVPETQPGLGVPANEGDATWNARFFPATSWAAPGGVEGIDFSGQPSSSVIIDTLGIFPFDGTFELIDDIQDWLDHPEANFGWMLLCQAESTRFTARQFASREYSNPEMAPQLTIQYTPPLRLHVAAGTNQVHLQFRAETAGVYSIERRSALGTAAGWTVLTNFGSTLPNTVLQCTDDLGLAQRFYRVRLD